MEDSFNDNKTTRSLIKNSFILGLGTLIPKIIAILILPILTTYLTTSEYGNFDLITSITSLIVPVVMLQIQQGAFRFLLLKKETMEQNQYINTSLFFIFIITIISAPITYLVGYSMKLGTLISLIMCLLVLGESLYLLLGQIMRGIGNNLFYSIGIIIYSFINAFLVFLLVYVYKLGLLGVVFSIAIAYLVSAIIMYIYVLRKFSANFSFINKGVLLEMLSFSAPIVPSSISLWIVNLSDRFLILYFLGSSANGIYSVANRIPALYAAAYGIFNLAWTETAATVADKKQNPGEYYSLFFSKLFDFLIGVMLIVIAISPLFYKIFINEQYYDSYYQTSLLYFGTFFNSIVMFYAGIYIAIKKTKSVGYSSAVGAILNLIINFALIRYIGLYAASISTLVSYLAIVIYRGIDIQKSIKLSYNFYQISIGIILMIISSIAYFSRNWVGFSICIIIAIFYNLFRNGYLLKSLLHKIKKR